MQHSKILILDFGSQVTQLIARRVREANVFCEVHPCDVSSDWVREYAKDGNLKGVILSGSHASVYEVDDKAPDAVFELGVPVLGICYGMQTMAQKARFGRQVVQAVVLLPHGQCGLAHVQVHNLRSPALQGHHRERTGVGKEVKNIFM